MSDKAPVRWRVDIEGVPGGLYESRAAAAYALRAVRSAGKRARLVRVETVSRRWRVGTARCYAWRGFRYWSFTVRRHGEALLGGQHGSYQEAVEAAERAARGQR